MIKYCSRQNIFFVFEKIKKSWKLYIYFILFGWRKKKNTFSTKPFKINSLNAMKKNSIENFLQKVCEYLWKLLVPLLMFFFCFSIKNNRFVVLIFFLSWIYSEEVSFSKSMGLILLAKEYFRWNFWFVTLVRVPLEI
jgi:hypothetical protein